MVTETWTDRRGAIARMLAKPVSGVTDRESFSRESIETTLANLAASAEA